MNVLGRPGHSVRLAVFALGRDLILTVAKATLPRLPGGWSNSRLAELLKGYLNAVGQRTWEEFLAARI